MNWITLKSLKLNDFGPFVGTHTIELPTSGLCLIKGRVLETGDGSGSGKSYLLKGVSHLFGGCPDAATDLQSWFSEEAPEAEAVIETSKGNTKVKRKKGLSISGDAFKDTIKGKAGESELDKIFGMDKESRAIVTYRGQRQPGLFLSLSDEKKKSFLGNLLGLDVYEKVAKAAQDRAGKLETEVEQCLRQLNYIELNLVQAKEALTQAELEAEAFKPVDKEEYTSLVNRIETTKKLIQANQSKIETEKTNNNQELEAVLTTIKAKTKVIYQAKEPIEITGLKSSIEKLKKELDEVKDRDNAAKLAVSENRARLFTKIKELKAVIGHKPRIESALDTEEYKVSELNSKKCSECKRPWDGEEHQKTLQLYLTKIDHYKKELIVIANTQKELEDTEKEYNNTKDWVSDPRGKELQDLIVSTNTILKNKLELIESEKRQKIYDIEQEEKTIKNDFSLQLNQKLQGIVINNKELQDALECAVSEERRLMGVQSQYKVKRAVIAERLAQRDKLQASYQDALNKKEEVQKACYLERDIVALIGRQGFLGTIVEEVLVEIAAVANDILSQVANVRHLSIDFETEKEAITTGNITAKITPIVYSRGRKVSLTSGISGGMQVAVELAVDLAVGEVVSRRRGSYPNWLILDECFDGLGGPAKESCLEMLQNHAGDKLILVVDHDASFQGLFHNVIEVEMVDGKSRIVV